MAPWIEWQERCAVALCSKETQAALLAFGGMRFRTLARRCLSAVNVSDVEAVMLPDADAWHLLETHMTLPRSSNAKAYKQWLFARAKGSSDAPFDVVQGGATLLMRSVVRAHLRAEYSPADHLSSLQPSGAGDGSGEAITDWLAADLDTRDAVALRELETIAQREAADRFADLPLRVRLALAAKQLRVPLATPALLSLARCAKSVMHASCRDFAAELIATLQRAYHGEDPATLRELSLLTFEALARSCVEWSFQHDAYRTALLSAAPASCRLEVTA